MIKNIVRFKDGGLVSFLFFSYYLSSSYLSFRFFLFFSLFLFILDLVKENNVTLYTTATTVTSNVTM